MGFWKTVRDVLTVPPAIAPPAPPKAAERRTANDRRAIAAEIVAAERSTGRSHWDVGVEISERHGLSVFDVHDEYIAEFDRQDGIEERRANPVKVMVIDPNSFAVLDLRDVPSTRTRIKGSANWVSEAERTKFGGTEYLLVREPKNESDTNAVAVYGKGRKVGYLSATKSAALAPILDPLAFDAFLVGGTALIENSIRLWVDIPALPGLRQMVKELNV